MSIYDDIFGGIDQVLDIVDDAVSSGNFSNMSERIRDVVEPLDQKKSTGNRWRDEGGKAGGRSSYNGGRMANRGNAFQGTYQNNPRSYTYQGGYTGSRSYGQRQAPSKRAEDPLTGETTFFKKVSNAIGSKILFGTGIAGVGFNGLFSILALAGTISDAVSTSASPTGGVIATTFFLTMTAGFGAMTYFGKKGADQAAHYKQYRKILSVNGYANISDIARMTDIPEDKVRKELKEMNRAGLFKQGHFDDKETCFIASDEMYQLYRTAEDNAKRLREEAEKERREQGYVSAELREVLDKGKGYVQLIREVNDEIPGQEVSDKLDRMEQIVSKIFEKVRENPEQADKLSMFMDYYLPTTAKLIIAYRDMDKKAVQGENIASAKREIENTLDMINEAFEKLFDSMFKEQSLDVQTDIDVMRTMMKQQGLAPNELDLLRRQEAAANARKAGYDMWGETAQQGGYAGTQTSYEYKPAGERRENAQQAEIQTASVQYTEPYSEYIHRPMTEKERRKAESDAVKAAEAKLRSGGTAKAAGGFAEQTSPILEWGGQAISEEE